MPEQSIGLRLEILSIRLRRQAGDANSGVALVADVQADQQRGDLLYDAGILQFAAIDSADTGNFCCQLARDLSGVRVVAADDDIAVERGVSVQQFSGDVVESGDHAHSFGYQFSSLLGGGALPDAEGAGGAPSYSCGERYCGVDEDPARTDCRLELFEQRGLAFEGNGEH